MMTSLKKSEDLGYHFDLFWKYFQGGRERVYWEKDLFSDVLSSSLGNMVLRDSIFFALKIKNKSVVLPKLNLFLFLIFD